MYNFSSCLVSSFSINPHCAIKSRSTPKTALRRPVSPYLEVKWSCGDSNPGLAKKQLTSSNSTGVKIKVLILVNYANLMNKKLAPWIIAAVFFMWAIFATTCSGPDEDHIREITVLETDNKAKDEQILEKDKTITKLTTRIAQEAILFKDTITIIEKEKIKLERNLARQRAKPEVIRIVKENPVIDTLIQTYDSIISKRDEQIYLQAKYVSQLQTDLSSVEANFREQIALHVQKFENEKKIADEYRDQARKERRKGHFAKVLIPIVGVAGFVLGSQL